MVSSTLGMTNEDLVVELKRIALEWAGDADYKEFRAAMPREFPF